MDIYSTSRCAIWYYCIRLNQAALIEMEFASSDITDGKVCSVNRGKISSQHLKEDQFKTIVMNLSTRHCGIHMSGIIPPLGQIAMRGLILGKANGWERRCGRRQIYCGQLSRS